MTNNKPGTDKMRVLFSSLPEKELPEGFRKNVMRSVMLEAARMEKRKERMGLLVTIGLAVLILAVGVLTLIYMEIPAISLRTPDLSTVPFYIYIGGLVFLLLAADYKLRKVFYEKHSK